MILIHNSNEKIYPELSVLLQDPQLDMGAVLGRAVNRMCGFLEIRFFSMVDASPTLPEPPTLNDINSVNNRAALTGLALKRRYIALGEKLYFNTSI